MKIVSFQQGTPEWHAWRDGGIGGSDAPAIEGNSPYKTARQVFFEKRGAPIEEGEDKEFIFAKGHRVEGLIRKEFMDLTGVEMKPICVIHPEFVHVRASLDGFDPRLGVLEAKLVGQEVLERARSGEIPAHHLTQMQHQFAASGADIGQWFGHDGKKHGVLIDVRADKEYIKRLLDKEHAFWEGVKTGIPPALTANDYLIPEDQKLLAELREAKEHAENAAIYYEALRKKVVETYKHPKIAGAGIKVFQVTRQGSLSLKDIPEVQEATKTLAPEYLEQFRGKGSVSWSVIMEKLKKESA